MQIAILAKPNRRKNHFLILVIQIILLSIKTQGTLVE